jgi:anti-anti-sigma regulatory factor
MKSPMMLLATVRIRDTEILSLACARLDANSGGALLGFVNASIERGTRRLVLDLGPATFVDLEGARALAKARARLGADGHLAVAGLSARARAVLSAAGLAGSLQIVEWWTDAVSPVARAA